MATSSTINVLLVEDSRTDVLLAEYSLSAGNFQIRNCQRLAEALKLLEDEQFDVALLDLGLPDSQGLDTLRTLREKNPHLAVVVLTGKDDEELALEALQEGAQDYLVKGQIQDGTLQRAVRYALERSRSEEALRASEDLFRSAFEYTGVAMGLTDMDNRFVRVNSSLSQLIGYSREELLTMSMQDVTHPDDLAESYDRRKEILAGPYNYFQVEKRYIHKDGRVLWGLTNISLVQDSAGVPVYYVGQVQDVTARKLTESALRLRERAIQAVSQGILISDPNRPDNPVIYASAGFERLTGYSAAEAIGRNCRFLQGEDTDQETVSQLRQAVQEGRSCSVEILNYRKDGSPFWNALSISPVLDDHENVSHFVGVQSDVTERRKLEEQLRQAQKMEAIGSLAGGVAHDFNNLLTIINGYSEAIENELPAESNVRNMAQEIREAGVRAASLTRQLLVFSRNQVLESKVFNLNDVVTDAERMLRRLIGEDVGIHTRLNSDLGMVRADPGQIELVLINLAVNARDAMPRGGLLTIETTNTSLEESYTQAYDDLHPGDFVLMAVSDTGSGMDEATKTRVFEPFFTTKETGKGTGLGLATVFGIVKQSEGHVAVYSELGSGTTFKVYLPRVRDAVEQAAAKQTPSAPEPAPNGVETILLAEDEPAVRTLARYVLESNGYKVLEADSGDDALRIADEYEGTIDLLVTDVVMPKMSGRELAERLAALMPDVKVLFLSGYTDDAVVRHGVLQAETAFLQKPFTASGLSRKVRQVLDESPG